jgi:Uri superfamily endonuclease
MKTTNNKYWHIDGLKKEATESTIVNIRMENSDEECGDKSQCILSREQ